MSDAEDRAGVEDLATLLDERQIIVGKLAPLWAKYGPGGTAEHSLSAERSRCNGVIRAYAASKEQKITEAALDIASREHPDYLALVARHTTERADYFRLNADLEAIELRVNRGQALLKMYASEARLG